MNQKLCLLICFFVGVLVYYLLKNTCGCKVVEGQNQGDCCVPPNMDVSKVAQGRLPAFGIASCIWNDTNQCVGYGSPSSELYSDAPCIPISKTSIESHDNYENTGADAYNNVCPTANQYSGPLAPTPGCCSA